MTGSPHNRTLQIVLAMLLLGAITAGLLKAFKSNRSQAIQSSGRADSSFLNQSGRPGRNYDGTLNLHETASLLSQVSTAAEARERLSELKRELHDLPPHQAIDLIASFLESGSNVPLPLSFKLGKNGNLDSHSSLRVALLDFISQIDPAAAADLGREILAAPTQADEWALALRNVARADQSDLSRDFLHQKTLELIANADWQENPSVGYFEAFDLLVHTGATESTPLLSSFIQKNDRKDLRHAAFLTLDRLAQNNTKELLTELSKDNALNKAFPEMVAQQFARANLDDPEQNTLVEKWLNHPDRTKDQKDFFKKSFPNNNRMVSPSLITTP